MIKNEREYRITRSQVANFKKALASLDEEAANGERASLAIELQQGALRSQLEELQKQVLEYEELVARKPEVINANSIEELPMALIKARIASGLTQAGLAKQLGLPEQQIQRYEATEFSGASLKRIKEITEALNVQIRPQIFLDQKAISVTTLMRKLASVGLARDFVERWLLSPRMRDEALKSGASNFDISGAVSRIGRVFGWDEALLLSNTPLLLRPTGLQGVRYKKPKKTDDKKLAALTVYAHYLALLALNATQSLRTQAIPQTAREFRSKVVSRTGSFGFVETLHYAWDLGIPVVPLCIPGSLHGAMWRVERRNVIVLKQTTRSLSRWLIDLLHEICHAKEHPEQPSKVVVEAHDPFAAQGKVDDEETRATEFAIEVALDGRAEELFKICVKEARGKVEWLKRVVPAVAQSEHVDQGVLANALAYRLSQQRINWWPTAAILQDTSIDPWSVARDVFIGRINLSDLNPIDREILMQAVSGDSDG
jgi:transcriptional regulator with XRE-family HTH domain